jgi:hypothetical protein
MTTLALVLVLAAVGAGAAVAGEHDEALRATAMDYAMGWYTGDAERIKGALHPDLAKRILRVDPETGNRSLDHMGAAKLVEYTRKGGGTRTPESERRHDITVLDVTGNAAVVKLVMHAWVDYLQMVKMEERWVIVNVLWEITDSPPAGGR